MKPREYFSNTSVFGYFIHLKITDNLTHYFYVGMFIDIYQIRYKNKMVFKHHNIQAHHPLKQDFPCSSLDKESACNAGGPGFDPWVRKNPWRRKWQPTPVFLPGRSPGRRSLPWGHNSQTRHSD